MQVRALLLVPLLALAAPAPAQADDGCAPRCDVASLQAGFLPPALVVESGSRVTWTTLDGPHTATEAGAGASACFSVFHGPAPGSANFTLRDGALWGQMPSWLHARRCATATELPDGSFALQYACLYHSHMKGILVVRPP